MPDSIYDPSYRLLCRRLIEARDMRGLTQGELGDIIGMGQPDISKIESGQRRVDVLEFLRICEALFADPHELIEEVRAHLTQDRSRPPG